MGLTNSEVLAPIEPETTPLAFINHANWSLPLAQFIQRQPSRRAFRRFVVANLRANAAGALPYLHRPIAYQALADATDGHSRDVASRRDRAA
jgi:hypothetical protein